MAILNVKLGEAGLAGVQPRMVYIETNDSSTDVLATGYLNVIVEKQGLSLNETDLAVVVTKESAAARPESGVYGVEKVGDNWSLKQDAGPGQVELPTRADYLAHFKDTIGTLSDKDAPLQMDGQLTINGTTASGYGSLTITGDGIVAPGRLNLQGASTPSGLFTLESGPNLPGDNVVMTTGIHASSRTYTINELNNPTNNMSILTSRVPDARDQSNIFAVGFSLGAAALAAGDVDLYVANPGEIYRVMSISATIDSAFAGGGGDYTDIEILEANGGPTVFATAISTFFTAAQAQAVWSDAPGSQLQINVAAGAGNGITRGTLPGNGLIARYKPASGTTPYGNGTMILNILLVRDA